MPFGFVGVNPTRAIWRITQVGLRGAPAKGVGRETGARVRISHSPLQPQLIVESLQT